jgi:hypothetical protein
MLSIPKEPTCPDAFPHIRRLPPDSRNDENATLSIKRRFPSTPFIQKAYANQHTAHDILCLLICKDGAPTQSDRDIDGEWLSFRWAVARCAPRRSRPYPHPGGRACQQLASITANLIKHMAPQPPADTHGFFTLRETSSSNA